MTAVVPADRFHQIAVREARRPQVEERYDLGSWMMDIANPYNLMSGVQTTWGTDATEGPASSFDGYVNGGYKGNGVVFAVIGARMRLFTEARFQYQRITNGRPGDLFGDQSLAILENPWPNGTTGDLLARLEQQASLAGNAYPTVVTRNGRREIRCPRPDWMQIVLGSESGDPDDLTSYPLGYLWWPKGPGVGSPVTLLPSEVGHYAPVPDPLARYRGMSWLTPVIEEIRADTAATRHKGKFFDNAATPNLAVSLDKAIDKDKFVDFVDAMRKHEGADNAYKTMWLAGGADVKVIGADLKQLDFKVTQGAGETRIAAAGGVPPLIVGLSEGLGAATYSNYAQARRAFADLWARPSWRQAAGALQALVPNPQGSRLWYDDRDIPFLQEDLKDESEVAAQRATTIRTLVDAGYEPASAVAAVTANDMTKLVHSGLYSVQLQAPGSTMPAPAPAA